MLNKVYKGKIDETVKKFVKTQCNQDNGNSNTACTSLTFISFVSTMDQVIQSSLQL